MSPKSIYRISAGVFLLFAAGHTAGFLGFKPPTAEALAVWDAMANVHFHVGHSSFSYAGFYTGFGLYVTVYLLFSAILAWHLATLAQTAPRAVATLGWTLCAVQIVSLILSVMYFSAPPAVMSAMVAGSLAWATLRAGRQIV